MTRGLLLTSLQLAFLSFSLLLRLIVFPRKAGKTKKGDTEGAADIDLKTVDTVKVSVPLPQLYEAEKPRAITSDEKEFEAYRTLRIARAAKRNAGQIKKRAE
jgi:large subunit ribosomal protein L13e